MNRRLISLILISLTAFLLLPTNIFANNLIDALSLGLEKEIGYHTYQQIIAKNEIVKLSQAKEDWLNSMFINLVKQTKRQTEIEYSVAVVKDDTVNAFALPAGYIFVHTGLLSYIKSDGELAGVLAHEIAHVEKRHSMKTISRTIGMSVLLSLIVDKSSEKRREQISKIGAVAISLAQLGYSREAEYEADAHGVNYMRAAGYNKNELLNFWKRMEAESGGDKNPAIFQLFSTHPPTSERIKKIEAM
ncbi:MAG: M48 family metalloprotease [Bacteroidota bacterium]